MRYLHTMIRVGDVDAALDFFCNKLGLVETRRFDNEQGRFTLIFLAAPDDVATAAALGAKSSGAENMDTVAQGVRPPEVELTHNWDERDYSSGRNFGHLAYRVKDIYAACQKLMDGGVTINRPPRDGHMAFVRSPDGISIELLQEGERLKPQEPWASMPNTGAW